MSVAEAAAQDAFTTDAFLGGRVTLVQPRAGHRAGLDAALLQALVPADAKGTVVDLGAGVGSVGFSVAARAPGISVIGIERDAGLVACSDEARQLQQNNPFAQRVRVIEGDVAAPNAWRGRAGLKQAAAAFVLMNPPFDSEERVRPSPDALRSAAHVAPAGLLRSWCKTADTLLKPGGTLGLIHRPEALSEILEALTSRFGSLRIRPVHPFEGEPAGRILLTARKGKRAPLVLLPGLILHKAGGAWTDAADALLSGRAELGP